MLLLAPRAEAGHRRLFADFDADGHRDRVTLDAREPWIVRIWLSATRSTHIIRSAHPLREITALDLNGDRRPELIASSPTRGLQVWTKAPSGFVAYPHRPRPPSRDISGSARHRVDDGTDGLPPGMASAKVTVAFVVTSLDRWAVVPDGGQRGAEQPQDTRSTLRFTPLSPRPPPALI
jgi:hypothetical protein